MTPETPDDFRERGVECERLAANAQSAAVRETLLFVAARWRELAAEDEGHQPASRRDGPQPISE